MKSIKVWVRTFTNKKTGAKFSKASCKGAYLPKGDIRHNSPFDESVYYNVKTCGASLPIDQDGQYAIYFNSAWVDTREGVENTIRVKGDEKSPVLFEFLKKSTAAAKKDASFPD